MKSYALCIRLCLLGLAIPAWGQFEADGLPNLKLVDASGSVVQDNDSNIFVGWGDNTSGQITPLGDASSDVIAIATGDNHSLAVKRDGSVIAWGANGGMQSNVPAGLKDVVQITATDDRSWAVREDGTVESWGHRYTEDGLGGLKDVAWVAVGGRYRFAVKKDGSLVSNAGQSANSGEALRNLANIAVGAYHFAALTKDGRVLLGGENDWGQLAAPPGLTDIVAVAAGAVHTIALKKDGTVLAWGSNRFGQLQIPSGLTDVVAIAARVYDNLALKKDGTVVAWGYHYGTGSAALSLNDIVAISLGEEHALALKKDGSVIAWGNNSYGQCLVPTGMSNLITLAGGHTHSVGLKRDGSVIEMGTKRISDSAIAQSMSAFAARPATLSDVVSIAAGYDHTVALTSRGDVVSWGNIGNKEDITSMPFGPSGYGYSNVQSIAAGFMCTAVVSGDGSVSPWGVEPFHNRFPKTLTNVARIACGSYFFLALKNDGTVAVWANPNYTKHDKTLGTGSNLTGVTAVAAGAIHALALKSDGTVFAWGNNESGQCIIPKGLRDVSAIATGGFHSLALQSNGHVTAWGSNRVGQATVKTDLSGVLAIAAGDYHSMALMEPAGRFQATSLGRSRDHQLRLCNFGTVTVSNLAVSIEGPDADSFVVSGSLPPSIKAREQSTFALIFSPVHLGPLNATLRISSDSSDSPYLLPLRGVGILDLTATKPTGSDSSFSYAPLRMDRQTGLMLQTIRFTNTTGVTLSGLQLILSKVGIGVQVYSSSAGKVPGTFEVIYSNTINANETISFDLVYFDPRRRTAESMNPVIKAEALLEPEPDSLPVKGTVVPLLRARSTPQGPTLEWNSAVAKTYVVEYSDDGGTTWFSAVHRLITGGTRMFWLDRGQPETKTKPVGVPNRVGGRYYRVKRL